MYISIMSAWHSSLHISAGCECNACDGVGERHVLYIFDTLLRRHHHRLDHGTVART
jgi:hypothetical protein